jgi:hypothetical protein
MHLASPHIRYLTRLPAAARHHSFEPVVPHAGIRPEGWYRQEVATLARALQLDMDSLEQAQAARLLRDRCAESGSSSLLGKAVCSLTVAHRQRWARALASCEGESRPV